MKLISPSKAAAMLGKNPETVRRWIRSGYLKASKLNGRLGVDEAYLIRFIEQRSNT